MIQLTTAAKLENAINKARTVKPRVRVNQFDSYTVTNKATGATYIVECSKRDNKRFAHCTCLAGERGQACYHVAAAVGAHVQLAAERQHNTLAQAKASGLRLRSGVRLTEPMKGLEA
ncbi:MAG: hypothetical protein M3R15_24985 [Acidobacteriota bacterium]|nr:hypothetical protein [Acidobacteriota bacterium]